MVRELRQRWSRRAAIVPLMALALGGAVPKASAEDGVQDFFSSIFGGAHQAQPQEQPEALPQRSYSASRPLTVRLHRQKVARFEPVPSKPAKVSIFEDRTLRRGDAVMTRRGMRIFVGSNTWPYRDDDFVGIANAGRMDKATQKTLISLDSLPRN